MENVQDASVLVLMSTYNGDKYLQEQLDSIFSQENVNVDILIRDDGSTDSTISLIQNAMLLHPDRVFLMQGSNLGYARSFTKLLEIAEKEYPQYDYYAFSDQDDVWLPQKLFRAVNKLENEKKNCSSLSAICYCSNLICVDSKLQFLKMTRKPIKRLSDISVVINPIFTGCTMLFNLKAVQLYVSHKHKYIRAHDYLMGLICFYLGSLIYDDDAYIYYRQHGNNQVGIRWSFSQRMKKRWLNLRKGRRNIIEKDACEFYESYKDLLPIDKCTNLNKIINYKKGLNRFRLLSSIDVKFESKEVDFFLKLKILLGRL